MLYVTCTADNRIDQIELIFVDDASTDEDATWNMLQEFERAYPESIMILKLEENMRQGGARNVALQYATGVASGLAEYELTLQVSLKLQQELTARGYQVLMIRTTNDVNISNSERRQLPIIIMRQHLSHSCKWKYQLCGKRSDDICPTAANPYCSNIYQNSRKLSTAS